MSIDREEFWHLLVNTNSLAELAVAEFARELAASPPAASPPALSESELAARLAEDFRTLDLSALDGLDWDPFASVPHRAPADTPLDAPPDAALDGSQGVDLAAYLEAAYVHEERLRRAVDAAFERADPAAIAALLGRLPAELPPLTRRLAPADMARWIAAYRADTPPLGELVAKARALWISSRDGTAPLR